MMSIELQATLRAQVEKFLNLCLYENATYLAERLVAEVCRDVAKRVIEFILFY